MKTRPSSSYGIWLTLVVALLLVCGVAIWRYGLSSGPPPVGVRDEGVPKETGASSVEQRSREKNEPVRKEIAPISSVEQRPPEQESPVAAAAGTPTPFAKEDEEWAKRGFIADRQTAIGADLSALTAVFKDYHRTFGQFPTGDSAAILKSLTGDNDKRMAFLGTESEMLDPWKTPYQFTRNGDEPSVEIRSAGPDRILWSDDDFVSKVEVPTR